MLRILYIVLFSGTLGLASAQDAAHTLAQADSLMRANDPKEALHACERVLHFGEGPLRDSARIRAAEIHYRQWQYHTAANMWEDAVSLEKDTLKKYELIIRQVQALVYNRQPEAALQALGGIDTVSRPSFSRRVIFYYGVIYYSAQKFAEAEKSFMQLSQSQEMSGQIKEIFREVEKAGRIKPGLAMVMSAVLPGSGQAYTGHWGDGLNSLTLNAGFIYLTYATAATYTLFIAAITVLPWTIRYYRGGIRKAKQWAREETIIRRQEAYQELLILMQATEAAR